MLKVNRNMIKCKEIENEPSYMSLGTYTVKDILGMVLEADMIMRSLDPGRLSIFAQFDTFRRS